MSNYVSPSPYSLSSPISLSHSRCLPLPSPLSPFLLRSSGGVLTPGVPFRACPFNKDVVATRGYQRALVLGNLGNLRPATGKFTCAGFRPEPPSQSVILGPAWPGSVIAWAPLTWHILDGNIISSSWRIMYDWHVCSRVMQYASGAFELLAWINGINYNEHHSQPGFWSVNSHSYWFTSNQ